MIMVMIDVMIIDMMMMIMIDMMIMTTIPCLGLLGAPLLMIATPVYEKPEVMLSIHIDDDNDGIHLNIKLYHLLVYISEHQVISL